ncbi:helicase associated domain-containing protein, partial [Streptomyces clavuligerus]
LRLGGRRDKMAHIFVPVVLEPGQDPVGALQGSAYGPVWQVVSALAAHDEALGAELDARRHDLGRYRSPGREGSLRELPGWLRFNGVPVPPRFAEAITVATVRSTTSSWEENLGAAAGYAEEHGDLLVRKDFVTVSGLALGQWIRWVRQLHSDGKLSQARRARLDELGMVWDVLDENFSRCLEAAAAYRAEHGHLRVPRGYTVPGPGGFALGAWIANVRSRRDRLSAGQREALDALGMVWAVFAQDWEQGVEAARAYRQREGHLRVPPGHTEADGRGSEGFALGLWLARKRDQRKHLTADRTAELDALGMVWNPWEDTWRRYFEAARAHHARHGHLDLPKRQTVRLADGVEADLGSWLSRQRAEMKAGTLSAERTAALDALGVNLTGAHERFWQTGITAARAFHAEFGHLNVPASHTTHSPGGEKVSLGKWLSKVRDRHSRGQLTGERISELDALDMVWDVHEVTWQEYYTAAQRYYRTHHHLRIPVKYVTGAPEELRLGNWISRQRADFRAGKLSVQRIKALTGIGMRWPT